MKHQPAMEFGLRFGHTAGVTALALLLGACGPSDAPATAGAGSQATSAAGTEQDLANAVVYQGARLIVGDGSAALENATVVVQDGRFTAVGLSNEVTVPVGAARVDLTGATLMPALIDTHTHLSTAHEALREDLRRRATYGVSAAMSLGSDDSEAVFAVRDAAEPGIALYRTAGRGITSPEPGRSEIPHWVTTEAEARKAVREEVARQVDIIKIWVDDRNGQYDKLSPALFGAVIDEAHDNDLLVTAHIFALEDAKALLRAGVDAFAHGVRDQDIDDEFVALIQERPEVVLVPNLAGRGVATDLEWLRGTIPDEQLQQLQNAPTGQPAVLEAFGIQARNLARLHEAGVRIALGTDGNTPWGSHIEMEDMVAAGMSPMAVLTAATGNGAAFMGLDERGTIATGKVADFLVLEANPLDDITNTRRIREVYLAGEPVARP